MYNVFK